MVALTAASARSVPVVTAPSSSDDHDRPQLDGVADLAGELLDGELLAGLDPVLLAARGDDRVHGARWWTVPSR
jgi:hypothetical protein